MNHVPSALSRGEGAGGQKSVRFVWATSQTPDRALLVREESPRVSSKPIVLIANPSPDVYGSDLQMLESVSALVEAGPG